MAKLMIVPTRDYAVLKKYLGASEDGFLVLVSEETLSEFPEEAKARCRELADQTDIPYRIEEPSVQIDIVFSDDSSAYADLIAPDGK